MGLMQMVAFVGVVQLAAMSPGPDFVLVTRHAALSGRRAGIAAAAGIACGVFGWAVVAAFGVAALLAASAVAFSIVKLAGAAYLAYLGTRSLRSAFRGGGTTAQKRKDRTVSSRMAFRQGLVTNLLNPKCAVFFVALMPQFVSGRPRFGQTLLLSAIAVLITVVWFTVVATVVGALRRVFESARVRRALDAVTGTVLVGLGVRIATQARAVP
jgi:RhtB (resistance to homoserine/threonine) family protein